VKAIAKGWKTEVPSINPETGEACNAPGIACRQDSFALTRTKLLRVPRTTMRFRLIFR
jgi:hypothetical protein